MLILTRKLGESIIIGDDIQISIVDINKSNIKLGVNAPKSIAVFREEIFMKIRDENKVASSSGIINITDFS